MARGSPYREILRLASEQRSELIVLGIHGRSAADLFFWVRRPTRSFGTRRVRCSQCDRTERSITVMDRTMPSPNEACDRFRHRPGQQRTDQHQPPQLYRYRRISEKGGSQRQRSGGELEPGAHQHGGVQVRIRKGPRPRVSGRVREQQLAQSHEVKRRSSGDLELVTKSRHQPRRPTRVRPSCSRHPR